MNAFKLSQLLYRILLRLHPVPFRTRFQDEMLWVFEEQSRHENLSTLLLDGLRSLLVQHVSSSHDVEPVQTGFALEIATSSLSSKRMLQAALGAAALTLGFAFVLSGGSPTMPSAPLTVAMRHHYPSFCEEPVTMKHAARKDRLARKVLPNRSK
jgi:hypothetical protein